VSFPRYPKYKDSGVKWLGEVPEHWKVVPVKNVATIINGYPFDSDLFDGEVGTPLVRIRDLEQAETECRYRGPVIERAVIASSDVLVGMDGDFNVGHWRGHGIALLNQRMCCIRGHDELLTRLLEYSLPIPLKGINDVTYSTTVKHLASSQIQRLMVAIPSNLSERRRVAAFLDRETAKLDGLVTEQQRLIGLLKEKRQTVTSQAVTKGLNPNASMKNSGVDWLGEVPAHWQTVRLGSIFREMAEPGTDDLPILSVSIHDGVSDRELNEEELDRKVTRSDERSKYKRVSAGDLVYNMMRAWQGGFGTVSVEGMVSPAYVVARPRESVVTEYIEHLLRTPRAVEQMRRHSRGVTDFRLRLYWDEFKNIRIALPPTSEAKAICERIARMDEEFDAVTSVSKASIALLQERRTALISAAVTGKIDVRHLADAEAA